jgi:hypothetical protein
VKTIIAGSRTFEGRGEKSVKAYLTSLVESLKFPITEVVSGCARGIDTIGEEWAKERGIPVKRFPADWDKHGKAAGAIRNREMAEYAEALVAIWDGESKGTKNMIQEADRRGLAVCVLEMEMSTFHADN